MEEDKIHVQYNCMCTLQSYMIWRKTFAVIPSEPVYITYKPSRHVHGKQHKVLHRSNHMYELKHFGMVWHGCIQEKCCGAHREPRSSLFAIAKGLEKYMRLSLFLWRPKNTSKIKRRRPPNRDIVSLVPVSLETACILVIHWRNIPWDNELPSTILYQWFKHTYSYVNLL